MEKRTHEEYSGITQGIHIVLEIIGHDRAQLRDFPNKRTDGFFRRTLLRQLFAETEAQLYQLRMLLQIIHEAQLHSFRNAEIAVLYEKDYVVNEKGECVERRLFVRSSENLQFIFQSIAAITENENLINRDSTEWSLFRNVNNKRDLVTHPRTAEDFEINDTEFANIVEVAKWLDTLFRTAHAQLNTFFFK
jgi:hypothetical protein